jgi:glycosyltransferase involved in cell wall biosynthesis
MSSQQPLVSVVTPVYNGESYLAECIESVLTQTYQNYEYIIVNNCSTDGTLQVARDYAKKDSRIRVINNETFVGVIANHNIAFRAISSSVKYCKVVSADDFIFPECISKLVELAESNPSVGIVGSYQLSGDHILWQGFKYPKSVVSGADLCRRIFLSRDKTFGFGTPTSLLYRADLVRGSGEFYPNPSPHSDTSACFASLACSDFGFVFEVLSFERTHTQTQSSASAEMNRYSSAAISDVVAYGRFYLSEAEQAQQVKTRLKGYHRFLAVNYFVGGRKKEFWDYHRGRLKELGFSLTWLDLFQAAATTVLEEFANPGLAIEKLRQRFSPARPDEFSVADSTAPVKEKKLVNC